jgi:hypothetical protein
MARLLIHPWQLKPMMKKYFGKKSEPYQWFKSEISMVLPDHIHYLSLPLHIVYTIMDITGLNSNPFEGMPSLEDEGGECIDCTDCPQLDECKQTFPLVELTTVEFEAYKKIHEIEKLSEPILRNKDNVLVEVNLSSLEDLYSLIVEAYEGLDFSTEDKGSTKETPVTGNPKVLEFKSLNSSSKKKK